MNKVYDVIVVGVGAAGIVAALAAKEKEADVLVLEKLPRSKRGGHAKHTRAAAAVSEDYTEEEFYDDIVEFGHGEIEPGLTRFLISESADVVKWLRNFGMHLEDEATHGWALRPAHGGLRHWPGGYIVGEGNIAIDALCSKAEELGIAFSYETSARKLLQNMKGRIVGVRTYNKTEGFKDIYARGGVILATGGFEANREMITKYLSIERPDELILRGPPSTTGDGHRMALEVGARPYGRWDEVSMALSDARSPRIESGETDIMHATFTVMVNRDGFRFRDEGEGTEWTFIFGRLAKPVLRQPGRIAFCIFDKKVESLVRPVPQWEFMPPLQADSLEELAKTAGINAPNFLHTIQEFNKSVQDGPFDPERLDGKSTLNISPPKSNWALTVDEPPFYAYPVTGGICATLGGVEVNENAEVIDIDDDVIPGLYAAGNVTGIIFHHERTHGGALTRALVFGRAAGRKAALEAQEHEDLDPAGNII